jgi:hypothetical protein
MAAMVAVLLRRRYPAMVDAKVARPESLANIKIEKTKRSTSVCRVNPANRCAIPAMSENRENPASPEMAASPEKVAISEIVNREKE